MDYIKIAPDGRGKKTHTSNAEWPNSVSSGRKPNISTDENISKEHAQYVCKRLESQGLGGEGKIFPIRTWVEEIKDER